MKTSRTHRIYLTGFMGSGKSTLGPILANTLGYSFIDLDKVIESQTGQPIHQLFQEFGEAHFRTIERSALEAASTDENRVIALGGGTITHEDSCDFVKAHGILIYLKSSVSDILRRLQHKTDRPLFTSLRQQAKTPADLHTLIISLLAQRELFYNQADIIINTSHLTVGRTVDAITRQLKGISRIRIDQ